MQFDCEVESKIPPMDQIIVTQFEQQGNPAGDRRSSVSSVRRRSSVSRADIDEPSGVTRYANEPLVSHSQLKIHFSIQQQACLFSLALTMYQSVLKDSAPNSASITFPVTLCASVQ